MTFKGIGEGFEGVVVHWNDGDRRGEFRSATLACKDGDLEASVEELVEDGWAEVASDLREMWGSVLFGGHDSGDRWTSYVVYV